jgi:hypothetical protein
MPPLPLSASVLLGSPNLTTIVFDQPLVPGALDETKWSGRINDTTQSTDVAQAVGNTAIWQSFDGAANVGPDIVSYDDAAADVVGRFNAFPAVSFTDFAIT